MTSRKRAVSIRMNEIDIGSVKKLARRLGVRDSDVIRCAVKMMMAKLGPLADGSVRGRDLVPVFVESGSELFRHFDLDPVRLETIINDGADVTGHVDHEDIQLIAMNGFQRSYVKLRLNAIGNGNGHSNGSNNGSNSGNGNGLHRHHIDSERDGFRNGDARLDDSLRQYLYDKYVYGSNGGASMDGAAPASRINGSR